MLLYGRGFFSAGAQPKFFRHNNLEHLEKIIHKYGPGIVAVDSVYSTLGSVCPLVELTKITQETGCLLVVDEAHSLGTHGKKGRGLVAELGLTDKVDFITSSLSKAFVSRAGIVICKDKEFVDYFKLTARPAIFSTALLDHEVARLNKVLDVIVESDEARKKLFYNADYLKHYLSDMGYNVDISESQIIPLQSGPESVTFKLHKLLEDLHVMGAVFCAPATPKNKSMLRLTVNSDLTIEQLDTIIDACYKVREDIDMMNWPSTRKGSSYNKLVESDSLFQDKAIQSVS